MKSYSVLIVDDEINILNSLKRLFIKDGYLMYTAQSGEEGLQILAKERIDLIIADRKMPGMSGIEFLEKTKKNYPDVIRIVITGYAELNDIINAINRGYVYNFILKPWHNEQLKIMVRRALEQYDLIIKNKDLTMKLKKRDKILK